MSTLTCPNCHCGFFIQKEIRKTGVVVIDGEAQRRDIANITPVIAFFCKRCGCVVPRQQSEKFKFTTQFENVSAN